MVRLVLVLIHIGWKTGESFKPITKLSNRNHVITFDSHLKTILRPCMLKHDPTSPKPAGRYRLGSDSPDLLAVPRTMFKTLDDRAFAKAGPSLWNELPVDT